MPVLLFILVLLISYLIGSIPFGYIVVRIATGKDVRLIESGRTGGTNVMRAAGYAAGILSATLDVLKGVASAWIVSWLYPGNIVLQVMAALMVIIGHNYSIFLLEKNENGKYRLRGGAGGATCLGGAVALWPFSWMFILPGALFVFLFIGYASAATMSIAFFSILLFAYRALIGVGPWLYVVYGIVAELILLWALRPNLKRLRDGNERPVGLRAARIKRNQDHPTPSMK
jgi:glycerol-3-phosphate acyltransferase PlsY